MVERELTGARAAAMSSGVLSGGEIAKPLANVSGVVALFSTLNVREIGGCCASSVAIG